jgi:hypothetical protein
MNSIGLLQFPRDTKSAVDSVGEFVESDSLTLLVEPFKEGKSKLLIDFVSILWFMA